MLMAVIAWVSAAPDAEAWTARELAEAYNSGVEQFMGSGNQNSYLISSRNVDIYLHTLEDGREVLVVHNFLGAFDVYFTVEDKDDSEGNTRTVVTCLNAEYYFDAVNGSTEYAGYEVTTLSLDRNIRVNPNKRTKVYNSYGYFTGYYNYNSAYDVPMSTYYANGRQNKVWGYMLSEEMNETDCYYYHDLVMKGELLSDIHGNPVILFGPYNDYEDNMSFRASYYDKNMQKCGESELFDGYLLTLYRNNATFSDSKNGEYNGMVDIMSNNQFGLTNFFNTGLAYNNDLSHGTEMPFDWDYVTGTATGNKFVIPQQMFFSIVGGTHKSQNLTCTNYYTFGYNPETKQRNPNNEITGSIEQGIPVHYGNSTKNWVHTVSGGDLHTYLGGVIKLDPWGMTDLSTNTNPPHWTSYEASVKNTEIVYADFKSDITFDCNLDVTLGETFGANGKDYVKAEFALTEKDDFCSDYTTHYDVYYLEGEYTHAANVPVDQAKKIQTVVFEDNKKTYTFSYDLPYPEGYEPTENPTESQKYTFFVVAHYNAAEMADAQVKAATNGSAAHLEATYHALTTVGKPLPTALNGLAVAEAQIKVVSGAVIVEGFDGVVEVYNAQGACVYTGTDSRIELNGGVYIVRAGTKAVKVVIG